MSYTRPSFNAANATWQGAEAYTRPANTAANASWVQGFSVSWINTSQFGIPVVPLNASGFQTSQFGPPSSPIDVIADADSVAPSQFGLASSVTITYASGSKLSALGTPNFRPVAVGFSTTLFGSHGAPGQTVPINATQFGMPDGHSVFRVPSVGRTSLFGTHLLLNNDVIADATHAGPSGFGTPYGYLLTHPVRNVVTQSDSVGASNIGVPSCPVDQSGDADGFRSTRFGAHTLGPMPTSRFGAHRSVQVQPATGFNSTLFGSHGGTYSGHVSGLRATRFGTPTYNRIHETTSVLRTRFGRARATQTGVYRAYGFCQTWFGHHDAIENVRHATGFSESQFGEHGSHEERIVLHIPPTSLFGVHLMTRG